MSKLSIVLLVMTICSIVCTPVPTKAGVDDWVVQVTCDSDDYTNAGVYNTSGEFTAYADAIDQIIYAGANITASLHKDNILPYASINGWSWAHLKYSFYYTGEGDPTPVKITLDYDAIGCMTGAGAGYRSSGKSDQCCIEIEAEGVFGGPQISCYQEYEGVGCIGSSPSSDLETTPWPEDDFSLGELEEYEIYGTDVVYLDSEQGWTSTCSKSFVVTSSGSSVYVSVGMEGSAAMSKTDPNPWGFALIDSWYLVEVDWSKSEPD